VPLAHYCDTAKVLISRLAPRTPTESYATRPGKRASFSSTDDEEEKVVAEADIVVEVDDEGEEEEGEEEEEINPRSSEEPSSFSGHFKPWPAYSQPLPIHIPSPGSRGQHVIRRLASLRLLPCDCDTTEQEHLNSRITPNA
jgi:hypothetical protein